MGRENDAFDLLANEFSIHGHASSDPTVAPRSLSHACKTHRIILATEQQIGGVRHDNERNDGDEKHGEQLRATVLLRAWGIVSA